MPNQAYRRYRGDMIEMWKMTHDKYDKDALGDFLQDRKSQNRGHPFSVYKLGSKHDVRKYSFRLRVTDQWNNLPDFVVLSRSLNSFKSNLDRVWKGSDVMYNPDTNVYRSI